MSEIIHKVQVNKAMFLALRDGDLKFVITHELVQAGDAIEVELYDPSSGYFVNLFKLNFTATFVVSGENRGLRGNHVAVSLAPTGPGGGTAGSAS